MKDLKKLKECLKKKQINNKIIFINIKKHYIMEIKYLDYNGLKEIFRIVSAQNKSLENDMTSILNGMALELNKKLDSMECEPLSDEEIEEVANSGEGQPEPIEPNLIGSFVEGTPEDERYIWINGDFSNAMTLDENFEIYLDESVTKISFGEAYKLKSLDKIPASLVDLGGILSNAINLTSYNFIEDFDFTNVTNLNGSFADECSIPSINLSNKSFSKLRTMNKMCTESNLTDFEMSNVQAPELTDMGNLFEYCQQLKTVHIQNSNFPKVTNVTYTFCDNPELTEVWLDGSNFGSLTEFFNFEGCGNLQSIELGTFENVTNISDAFVNCNKLKTIDLSYKFKKPIEEAQYLFQDCSNLTTINLKNVVFASNCKFNEMFDGCDSLERVICDNSNKNFLRKALDNDGLQRVVLDTE